MHYVTLTFYIGSNDTRARAGDFFGRATSEQRQQRSVFPAAGIRRGQPCPCQRNAAARLATVSSRGLMLAGTTATMRPRLLATYIAV